MIRLSQTSEIGINKDKQLILSCQVSPLNHPELINMLVNIKLLKAQTPLQDPLPLTSPIAQACPQTQTDEKRCIGPLQTQQQPRAHQDRQRSAWVMQALPHCAGGIDAQTLSDSPGCWNLQRSLYQRHNAPLWGREACWALHYRMWDWPSVRLEDIARCPSIGLCPLLSQTTARITFHNKACILLLLLFPLHLSLHRCLAIFHT